MKFWKAIVDTCRDIRAGYGPVVRHVPGSDVVVAFATEDPEPVTLHEVRGESIRGRVSRVGIIRGGQVSVVLRFDIEDGHRAKVLEPGQLLELVSITTTKPENKK